jgi:hypothetical protein
MLNLSLIWHTIDIIGADARPFDSIIPQSLYLSVRASKNISKDPTKSMAIPKTFIHSLVNNMLL